MKYFLTIVLFAFTFSIQSVAAQAKGVVLDDVEAKFQVSQDWGTGFSAAIALSNNGKDNVNGWYVEFDLPQEITHVWNADLVSHEGNHYIFKNTSHNPIIKKNRSVYFGIQGELGNVIAPSSIIVKDTLDVNPADVHCSIDFKVTSDWHSAFNADMTITNNGDEDITGWVLEFDFKHKITQIWDACVLSVEKNGKYYHYKIKNLDHNVIIIAGKSIKFGFTAKPGNHVEEPFNIKINGKDPSGGDTNETVILVYKTLVRAYVHRNVDGEWKYEGDESKLTYYDVIEFTPETRDYKQAKRIIINFDGSVSEVDGLDYVEYSKEPKDGETDVYMKYLVGSRFESDNDKFGSGEAMYGKVVLGQKSSIGWKEKVAIARSMTGKFNLDSSYTWKNYNYYTRFESKLTKKANESGLTPEETVKSIISSLK